jgi:Polyketide cyclase / dehydrase and lipid transport
MESDDTVPSARTFTSAPLRHRWRVELNASIADVWPLVGDLARLPEYSAGLERVDVSKDSSGAPAEYVCHFKPMEEGGSGPVSRDFIRWHMPDRGWASVGEEPNEFGLRNSLHLVTLEPSGRGTVLNWVSHYDAADLATNRSELDKALADIADRLIGRFGGHVLERYVDG